MQNNTVETLNGFLRGEISAVETIARRSAS